MKKIFSTALVITCFIASAQDDDCMDRIMAKEGKWVKLKETVSASATEYAIQKKFSDAVYNMISPYRPFGVQPQWSGGFSSPSNRFPVTSYSNLLMAMKYYCKGSELELDIETNTTLDVRYNFVRFLDVYDTATDYHGAGFFDLREGFPTEIKPGVWQFKDARTPLGFGREGLTKNWFFTYPGQLPWAYVTRREFLLKRKRNVLRQYAEAKKQTQEAIDYWDKFKKEKEKEYANDAVKMANFMSGYYNPGLAEAKAKQPKILGQYEAALERIDEQLSAPAAELEKVAIVIKSQKSFLDYDFTDKMEPFAALLTKPNPAYFRKGMASSSVPQMISVAIKFDPKDPRSARFAADIEKLLNVEYIQSFIGKIVPPSLAANKTAQHNNANNNFSLTSASTANNKTQTVTNNNFTKPTPTTAVQTSSSQTLFLTGTLSAPAGVPVTISYNSNNDLTITPPKGANNLYNTSPIKFPKAIKENEEYSVSIKKIASNMKGVVYHGKGKAPDGAGKIKIGIDYTYELLTRSSDDKIFSSFYESFAPAVGGYNGEEGRYVVFVSNTKGLQGSDGKFRQVYWRDRNTGITKMISVSPNGEQANGDCNEPSISTDGKIVVFESKANNLVAGDDNNFNDIFLWRAATNTIELISKSVNGGGADAECFDAAVSGNGNFVVFTSSATNLSIVPKGRSAANIFLRDVVNGKTEMISVDPLKKEGGNGYKASISFDGSRISFCSASPTLVANDNNGLWDIFLWQKGQSGLKRISMTHDGKERNAGGESASRQVASAISGNGRYVAFATTASNMMPNDDNKFQDVFVVDVETGKISVASFTNEGLPSNDDSPIEQGERVAISYDGTWVAFPTKATNLGAQSSNLILYNTQTGKNQVATNTRGSYIGRPAISYSGGYVLFGKSEPMDQRLGAAFGHNGGGIFAHFTGNGPCRDCKE